MSVKVAVVVRPASIERVHVIWELLQSPVHPVKTEPIAGVAVSVTEVPPR